MFYEDLALSHVRY